ncbi:hypothetical protein [Alkalitalea saponilacus]|uniref:Dolichyl-phosphate-mannose-protein mannosyltransferase n=1 Tax=Alkalitalea saponilacus TaxID=889453 RepID=A0A1T5A6X1_9BACT|nr:hypothetical protein [Alkalitalea saponilacus]ASB48824.1 hypothetical protein CDL62_06605 [Alkalitalea saponilacus]SKB30734.1 hypothetical protein SAMN03080601_00116 [Alkalitalea saponilacus]
MSSNYLSRSHYGYFSTIVCFLFFVLYLIFPVYSSTLDAYSYATQIKEGRDLFLHHHLLYNLIGWYWVKLASLLGIGDVLSALIIMNAVCAFLSLYILDIFLKQSNVNLINRIAWLIFVGASWGVMRFATENETYLMPIVASMAASLALNTYLKTGQVKMVWVAGFLAAFAALIHQIHFFWWLGLFGGLFYYKRLNRILLYYFIPALMVPMVYALVMVWEYDISLTINSFFEFILHDYYNYSRVNTEMGWINFILTPISFIRTFVQVHGYIPNLLTLSSMYLFGMVVGLTVLIIGFFYALKSFRFKFRDLFGTVVLTHLFVFTLHLTFAFISHGNAEFMVMLPFLLAMIFGPIAVNNRFDILKIGFGVLIWNLTVGIVPLNKYFKESEFMVSNHIISNIDNDNPPLYLVVDHWLIIGRVAYSTGEHVENIINGMQMDESDLALDDIIVNALIEGREVYTDCLNRPSIYSRRAFVYGLDDSPYEQFLHERVDSISTLYGKYYLTKLTLPTSFKSGSLSK